MSLSIYRVDYSPYFAEDFMNREWEAFKKAGFEPVTAFRENVDVLITNTSTSIDRLQEFDLRNVKLILHPNSGFDNFNPDFIQTLSGPVVLGNPLRATAVAENIITHLMERNQQTAQTEWVRDKKLIKRKLLNQQKALIYGNGHIGTIVSSFLEPIMKQVDKIDPYLGLGEPKDLKEYDSILLCCSLNSKNRHMIDRFFLSQLKEDVTIINSARGPLIEWEALVEFLNKNPKAKAYLDVFEKEPHSIENYLDIKNLHMTSHIAGVYEKLDQNIIDFEIEVLKSFKKMNSLGFFKKYQKLLLSSKIVEGEFI